MMISLLITMVRSFDDTKKSREYIKYIADSIIYNMYNRYLLVQQKEEHRI